MPKENENQNLPPEYLPVVSMTKKEDSLRTAMLSMKSKIMTAACEEFCEWPTEKQDRFLERAIISIAKDEKLIPCFESTEGKLSIIKAFESMVSTCLEIDGKHAYLVPQNRNTKRKGKDNKDIWVTEIRFSIKDVGYLALLCGGKYPIFKDLRWNQVYKNEASNVIIDSGTGEVKHPQFLGEDKGAMIGCWVQIIKMNGQKEVTFFPLSKINQWKNDSDAYQYAVKNNYSTPWKDWPEEMAMQACIRHMCQKYEKARELLKSAIYDEDEKQDTTEKTSMEKIDAALKKPGPLPAEKQAQLPEVKETITTETTGKKPDKMTVENTSNAGELFAEEKEKDPLDIF
ncbi:MAG: recombinase RecT [Candidatus Omnitrophica bacterium]|nr:recombinase RecT [Candidatus Omnitrophota bacterium]MDD5353094.1 recombinase RecT [Candidatus Omnitrophota bacterium]